LEILGVSSDDFKRLNLVGTPEDFVHRIREYADLGVRHFMLFFGDFPRFEGLRAFAETMVGLSVVISCLLPRNGCISVVQVSDNVY